MKQYFVALLLLSSCAGCCRDEIISPQVVNVDALERLPVPKNISHIAPVLQRSAWLKRQAPIESGIIEWVTWSIPQTDDAARFFHIDVNVQLFVSEDSATTDFDSEWRFKSGRAGSFRVHGRPGNQSVVSYNSRPRVSEQAYFGPGCYANYFYSFVMFQKGRVVISIDEVSNHPDGSRKEHVMCEIANAFQSAGPSGGRAAE